MFNVAFSLFSINQPISLQYTCLRILRPIRFSVLDKHHWEFKIHKKITPIEDLKCHRLGISKLLDTLEQLQNNYLIDSPPVCLTVASVNIENIVVVYHSVCGQSQARFKTYNQENNTEIYTITIHCYSICIRSKLQVAIVEQFLLELEDKNTLKKRYVLAGVHLVRLMIMGELKLQAGWQ